jgi:hypothetical protein
VPEHSQPESNSPLGRDVRLLFQRGGRINSRPSLGEIDNRDSPYHSRTDMLHIVMYVSSGADF